MFLQYSFSIPDMDEDSIILDEDLGPPIMHYSDMPMAAMNATPAALSSCHFGMVSGMASASGQSAGSTITSHMAIVEERYLS